MIVYIIRHAQSEGNLKGFFQGNIDSELTELGQAQAAHTGRWLARLGIRPEAVYSSPLARAASTAQAITSALGIPPARPHDALREYRAGKLEGLLPHEVEAQFPEYKDRPLAERGDFSAYGGESYDDMRGRLQTFISSLYDNHEDSAEVLAVSHGGAIYQLLKLWCGWPAPRHYFTRIGNCSCFKLETRTIAGVRIAELQWIVPLELTGWQADGVVSGAENDGWIERQ